MSALNTETILSVHHWNDTLFSFRTTRDQACASSMASSS
jgi:ferredoxin--NADP+ reductase